MNTLPADLIRRLAGVIPDVRAFSVTSRSIHSSCTALDDWKYWRGGCKPDDILPKMARMVHYSLTDYVRAGNFDMVALTLDSTKKGNMFVNLFAKVTNSKIEKALIIAAEHGYLEIVKRIIQVGAEPFANGCCVIAAYNGHLEVVKYLATYTDLKQMGNQMMRLAASGGYLDMVKYLVKAGVSLRGLDGIASPLYHASLNGHLNVVKYIVEQGEFTIKARAFSVACEQGHLSIVRYLTECGKIKRANGDNMQSAFRNKDNKMIKYLAKFMDINYNNDAALRCALNRENLSLVRYFIKLGANIHLDDGWPLRFAAERGDLELVRYLVEHGAIVGAKDNSALIAAAKHNRLAVVKYLVKSGANVFARSSYTLTQLIKNGHTELSEYIR